MAKPKYIKDIFETLSKGKFISQNSVDEHYKLYYDDIVENLDSYTDFYKQIGFDLNGDNGYFYFSRQEAKQTIMQKIQSIGKWIDYLDVFKSFNPAFCSGFEFRKSQFSEALSADINLQNSVYRLIPQSKNNDEIFEQLIKDFKNSNFIEQVSEIDLSYRVTSAFNYVEKIIESIQIDNLEENEVSE